MIDAGLVFILLMISLFRKSSPVESIVLTVILVPLALIVLESFLREVTIGDDGITIRKILRKRSFGWGDITDVGTVILRKKVYLVLTTTKGFHIISNAYEDFAALVKSIVDRVESEKVEEPVKTLIGHPVRKFSDVVSAWVGAVVLLVIIYVKLFQF